MKGQASKCGLWLAGLIILQCILGCGKRCRDSDMDIKYYHPIPHSYFHVFEPSRSWVLQSSSGIRDSVHVVGYSESYVLNLTPCMKYPERKFAIIFPAYGDTLFGIYSSATNCTSLGLSDDLGVSFLGPHLSQSPRATLIGYMEIDDIAISDVLLIRALSPPHIMDEIYIAPNIGIVRYIRGLDTLNIDSAHVY